MFAETPHFRTKSMIAYACLKEAVVSGELKPGQRLLITDLAKLLGVSAIPVREAINKLISEELVTHVPHVGTIVSAIGYERIKENYIIRTELEGLATRYATEHLTDLDFQMLQGNIDYMEVVIERGELSKVGSINKEFHRIIYEACPYKKIYKMIFDLWNDIDRMRSVFALAPSRAPLSLQEHKDILKALQKKDGYQAEFLVKMQKQLAWKDLESYYERENSKLQPARNTVQKVGTRVKINFAR